MIKKFAVAAVMILGGTSVFSANVEISGSDYVAVTPSATSGLQSVFVARNAADALLSYTAGSTSAASSAKWYRFNAMGAAYAEQISGVTVSGNTTSVRTAASDMGYLIEADGRQTAVWVVDYASHFPSITSFSISADSDCDRVVFNSQGQFDAITYYSINGAPIRLSRDIILEYQNLVFSGDDAVAEGSWIQETQTSTFADITGTFSVMAPLCNTTFTLKGDMFLEKWGDPIELTSDTYQTRRVEAKVWALQDRRNNDNEQKDGNSEGLGGSAPCDITFVAVPTDAVAWNEWQFSSTEDFADVEYRFTDLKFAYSFTEAGTTYVRFVCADASGDCMYESDTFTVNIGESKLLCPNAFSPHNQDGINDEWKVSYASLVSYECHIFNRWGHELFRSNNPAEGWDGRTGGKFVPSGVYFYVIKAEGADGKKYNLSGDINIIGTKVKQNYTPEE